MASFGPAMFILMQSSSLLMAVILIGDTTNEYIESILTSNVNPITMDFIPKTSFPKISIKGYDLPLLETNKYFAESGYEVRVSFFVYMIMILQILIVYFAFSGLAVLLIGVNIFIFKSGTKAY